MHSNRRRRKLALHVSKRISRKKLVFLVVLVSFVFFLGLSGHQNVIGESNYNRHSSMLKRKLNILTLGGSITRGAAIPDQKKAYPYLLQDIDGHKVENLAIRGTGSDYPALCITSMLSAIENQKSNNYHPEIPFDVIVFEFSINGFSGFELLLKRIKERFPDALLIYVDLWSLTHGSLYNEEVRQMIEDAGGYVYSLGNKDTANPITPFDYHTLGELSKNSQQPDWIVDLFADDRHHLSENGHMLVKDQVSSIIKQYGQFSEKPRQGSWLGGDLCKSWFEDGKTPLQVIKGGSMNEWDDNKHKWAIEPDDSGLVLEYFHDGENETPLHLNYMTKAPDRDDLYSSKYPPVIVKIAQDEADIKESKRPIIGSDVLIEPEMNGINLKLRSGNGWNDEGWSFISGLNKRFDMRGFHVNDTSNVGMLKPGRNIILIYPVGKREYPFRLTATIVCDACVELGFADITLYRWHK
jgi:hypothetical protein